MGKLLLYIWHIHHFIAGPAIGHGIGYWLHIYFKILWNMTVHLIQFSFVYIMFWLIVSWIFLSAQQSSSVAWLAFRLKPVIIWKGAWSLVQVLNLSVHGTYELWMTGEWWPEVSLDACQFIDLVWIYSLFQVGVEHRCNCQPSPGLDHIFLVLEMLLVEPKWVNNK